MNPPPPGGHAAPAPPPGAHLAVPAEPLGGHHAVPAAPPGNPSASSTAIDAVALSSRLAEFWTDQPRVWFIRTEAIITPQRLSDEAKFDLVISKLSKEVIAQVTDILVNPPTTDKYNFLKNRLLTIYEESQNRQIEKLISELELGEQKPSQLLRRMRELATNKFPDDTLRVLWQNRLPSQVRVVLAVSEGKDLESLAAIADKVAEVTQPAHVAELTPQPQQSFDAAPILAEIAKINSKLRSLHPFRSRPMTRGRGFWRNSSNRSRSRTPSGRWATSTSPSRNRKQSENRLCFYHNRFRENAHKCTKPCAWKNSEN